MTGEVLYDINQWLLFFILLLIYFFMVWGGYRIGIFHYNRQEPRGGTLIFIIQASVLVLLAFLLGFTFAMAVFRYEIRRDLIIEESNAIYTANLRTKLLPEPFQKEMRDLLQRYLKLRSEDLSSEENLKKLARFEKETTKLQMQMWDKVTTLATENNESNTLILLMDSVNRMIDFYTKREMAMANHVPEIIIFLLFFASSIALFLAGYTLGLENSRNYMPIFMYVFLIVVVTVIIIDLDRPRRGLIRVNLSNIINLKELDLSQY